MFLLLILTLEALWLAPLTLSRWHAFDYENYRQAGRLLLSGQNPYGPHRYYPLPTVLWIFVPLALLPEAFRLLWVLGAFLAILIVQRKDGWLLFFFFPLWIVVRDGMLEGWLLLPLAVFLRGSPGWAGLTAALLLLKPQLALLPLVYALLSWLRQRDWRNVLAFGGGFLVLFVPTFILMPGWPAHMLAALADRVGQYTQYPGMSASLWAWRIFGWPGWAGNFLLLGVALFFFREAWRWPEQRLPALLALGLLLTPYLFGSSMLMLIPLFKERNEILSLVGLSFLAVLLDVGMGHFGGGFAFLPLFALWRLSRR
ncbi:MAG: hypothetical protein ACP5QU_08980 [Anaerolineae bacterium]